MGGMKRANKRGATKVADERSSPATAVPARWPSLNGLAFRTRFFILLTLFALTLVFAVFVDAPKLVISLFAKSAIEKLEFEQAEKWLDFGDRWLSKSAEIELLWARLSRKQSKPQAFLEHLESALKLGASPKAIDLERVLSTAESGGLASVENKLLLLLQETDADVPEISNAYANGLAAQSRFPELLQVLDAWQKDYPSDPRPDYRRGRLEENHQNWELASKAYLASLERMTDYYPSRYRLGRVYLLERKTEKAKVEFEKCLAMPFSQAAKASLALCYKTLGESDKASLLLQEVLASSFEEIQYSYRILEESSEYFEAAATYGELELEVGNLESAEKWLLAALEKNERDLQSRYTLAVTLRQLGKTEEAQQQFELVTESRKALEQVNPLRNAIAEAPNDPKPRLALGELLLKYESIRSGLFWINSVFAIAPDHKPAHAVLAKFYREQASKDPAYNSLAELHERQLQAGPENSGSRE